MSNSQQPLRFYIDQADDKAVIRAVPVKPVVVNRSTHRVTVADTPVDSFTVAETRAEHGLPAVQRSRSARAASERMLRLVRRHNQKSS